MAQYGRYLEKTFTPAEKFYAVIRVPQRKFTNPMHIFDRMCYTVRVIIQDKISVFPIHTIL